MIDLGLSKARMAKLQKLMVSNHSIAVTVQLMNLEHKSVSDLGSRLLGGQVTIDSTQSGATRSASIELLDPYHTLKLDSDAPEDGSLYFTKMIRITYSVMPPDRSDRFDIPIFTGPLTKVERNGSIISIECMGKEKLASASVWKSKQYKKGAKKTWVIRSILRDLGGEADKYIDIPDINKAPWKEKTPGNLTVGRERTPWDTARKVARSMGLQLFYDGRGVARLRRIPKNVVYTFAEKGALLSEPQASYDAESVINAVYVIGGKPKKAKKKVTYRIVAPASHPLSPAKLGRFGKPRYLPETINDSNIKSTSKARAIAKDRLKSALIESVEVAFDTLPIVFLEELDLCRVTTQEFASTFRLQKMTIPLTADGTSSVGYLRRANLNSRQAKIKRPTKKKRRR